MSQKVHERRIAREAALSILYSIDIAESDVSQVVQEGLYPDDELSVSEYSDRLVFGVMSQLDEIDSYLVNVSKNWSLERMPFVDRAILRLAVYEMLFVDEVPISVSINEAVELAKLYGAKDESPSFVNGILGRIDKCLEEKNDDNNVG